MRRRRGRGEGAIYKRGDTGLWCSIITVGYDQVGKRKRRYVYGKSKKEVQEKLLKLHDDSSKGMLTNSSKISVGDFLRRWLEDVVKSSVRASTFERYELVVRLHIVPFIGGIQLGQIGPLHIQSEPPQKNGHFI